MHAHPDDETLFTGGLTALAADRGWRVTLVTCTDGRFGIDPSGRPGTHPAHDPEATVRQRDGELTNAAALVGVARHVRLGYRDSGMVGWPQNEHPDAFVRADVATVAMSIAALLRDVDADLVVTYDAHGYYGHPDHIQTHRVTWAAVAEVPTVAELWFPVTPARALAAFRPAAAAAGVRLPAWVGDAGAGADEADVHVVPATLPYAAAKHAALAAHASQIDNADLLTMPPPLFTLLLGQEYYHRGLDRSSDPSLEEGLL